MSLRRLVLMGFTAVSVALGIGAGSAMAQPSGAKGDDFLYRVRQGDTLGELATRYTTGRSNWTMLQELNNVERDTALPIAKMLRIPFAIIPEVEAAATVTHVSGTVTRNGQAIQVGDTIVEGQTLTTAADGYLAVEMSDRSVLSLPAASELAFDRIRVFRETGLIDVIIQMDEGALESSVAPDNTGVGRFEVRTPVSVTGVRGTRMRVHASPDGVRTELIEGRAGVDATQSAEVMLSSQQGVAVDPQGTSLGVRPLLPPPQLNSAVRSGSMWTVSFDHVDGASGYLVQVAADPEGKHVVSRERFETSPVRFSAPGPGTWSVLVRAIDTLGMEGLDASQDFEGRRVLLARDGTAVSTGHGQFVVVADY